MGFFRPRPPQAGLLVPPPPIKISIPQGDRLAAIMDGTGTHPAKARDSAIKLSPISNSFRWSSNSKDSRVPTLPRFSADLTPPDYVAEPPHMHEKLGRIDRFRQRRGGWGRVCLLLGLIIILLLAIALGVGLGVGLTRGHGSHKNTTTDNTTSQRSAPEQFPLGQFSLATALADQRTDCTSNAATWSCYPYTTYSMDPMSSSTSFGWALTNTSAVYPTNSSMPATSSDGVPANVTISATNNPFAIEFDNQDVTYVNNASDPRYTFSFTMSKMVVPSSALTDSNQATTCFFNATIFSATLYLSDSEASPKQQDLSGSSMAGYTPWPYAVEVRQQSRGGSDVPACYYTNNGVVGDRVTGVLVAQPAADMCVCEYRNSGL